MSDFITGIQQVGIGVQDADHAKYMYRNLFGMNALVFDDIAEARLMTRYTGDTIHKRRAILTMNMNGGGGFEIWQFLSRTPSNHQQQIQLGTIGINTVKIKAVCINKARQYFQTQQELQISAIEQTPNGDNYFIVKDAYDNLFEIVEGKDWFKQNGSCVGGVSGVSIGVRNMDKALAFYQKILGEAKIVHDAEVAGLRKVLLYKALSKQGAFSKLLGGIEIELIHDLNTEHPHIFEGRYWGDPGFIHVCLDVTDMDGLKTEMEAAGYPFTVDSANAFAMETASGRFCYVEDPDGTLIELVQTHKVPIFKKLGLYLNLNKRKHNRPLPNWMVGMLGLNKVK